MGNSFRTIGLTGGIASGKSTVAQMLRTAGYMVVDLDTVGRELTDSDSELINAIDTLCGGGCVQNGKLNRTRVRETMFSSPELRAKLEALLHPKILASFQQQIAAAKKRGEKAIVCEAALLFESGYAKQCDAVIVVVAEPQVQRARLIHRDSISDALADQMIASQWKNDQKQGTFLIRNDATIETLRAQVAKTIASLKASS